MRYHARIEVWNSESATWQAIDSEHAEENTGTASEYGRKLLAEYLRENLGQAREVRVQVWAMDNLDSDAPAPSSIIALIDDPAPVSPEIAAVEAEMEEVLHRRRALKSSIEQLSMRLREAQKAGHRGSALAELAHPALTREYL